MERSLLQEEYEDSSTNVQVFSMLLCRVVHHTTHITLICMEFGIIGIHHNTRVLSPNSYGSNVTDWESKDFPKNLFIIVNACFLCVFIITFM